MITIPVGRPPAAAAEIAMLYFDIFSKKLGLALGRRDVAAMMAGPLGAGRAIVARK